MVDDDYDDCYEDLDDDGDGDFDYQSQSRHYEDETVEEAKELVVEIVEVAVVR